MEQIIKIFQDHDVRSLVMCFNIMYIIIIFVLTCVAQYGKLFSIEGNKYYLIYYCLVFIYSVLNTIVFQLIPQIIMLLIIPDVAFLQTAGMTSVVLGIIYLVLGIWQIIETESVAILGFGNIPLNIIIKHAYIHGLKTKYIEYINKNLNLK